MRPLFHTALAALVCVFLAAPGSAEETADTPPPKAAEKKTEKKAKKKSQPSAPRPDPAEAAADGGSGELARAIREARRELDQARVEMERSESADQARIAAESRSLEEKLDQESKLASRLQALGEEMAAVDAKLAALPGTGKQSGVAADLGKELAARISGLRERLEGGILATQDPQTLDTLAALRAALAEEPAGQVRPFLDICAKVLQASRTADVTGMHLRVASAGGKVEPLRVLRLGNVTAYFSRPANREGGFVVEAPGEKTGFIAESRGLTPIQMERIVTTVQKPDKGGVLPCDVSGGTGLALLGKKDTLAGWFQRGGVWMWPIVVLAVLAAYLILERGAVLLSSYLSANRKIRRITALVRAGRVEAAEAECENAKGTASRVCGAVLGHRTRERPVLETAVQESLLRAAPHFQLRLGFISLVAALAPLAGFLGTVAGLVTTFQVLDVVGLGDPRPLTGGLADALIPTVAGLLVAIPCVLFRGLLGALAESSIGKLETGALGLLVALEKGRMAAEEPVEIGERA